MKAKVSEGRVAFWVGRSQNCSGPLDPRLTWARIAIAALVVSLAGVTPASAEPFTAYSDTADAPADVAAALDTAKAEHKLVLVVFGANWCPDCRAFDGLSHNGSFANTLARSYVVVHADVGRFTRNLDLAARFGLDVKRGIPAFVVASPAKGTLDVADGRALDTLMKGGDTTLALHFAVLVKAAQE